MVRAGRRIGLGMTRSPAPATRLAIAWTILLVALAALWVRSPFLGERAAFLLWSGPAAVLLAVSVRWFRAKGIEEIPDSRWLWTTVGALLLVALGLTASDVGRILMLDGLILREPWVRRLGQVLRWGPLAFGCGVSLAGLAAALEARYRLARRPVSAPGTPANPPG